MDPYHLLFLLLFWGSLSLAGLALILTLLIPKYRKQLLKIQSVRTSLEERYAKELAAGTAVIIPKDPVAWKKLFTPILCGGIIIFLFLRLKAYTSYLQQTCTSVDGWNGFIVFLGGILVLFIILAIPIIMGSYTYYKEIIEDGYVPSRKSKQPQDRIAFKLTKWGKIREQLRLVGIITCYIVLTSSPLLILHTFINSQKKPTSLYEFNDRLQKSCLNDLKKKS